MYLPGVAVWVWEDADVCIAGFIGMQEAQVEMLFVDPGRFGQGIGTELLDHARKQYSNITVDVNEQNPQAHEFYRRYGFEDVGRSATDSAGMPFPLVHMALKNRACLHDMPEGRRTQGTDFPCGHYVHIRCQVHHLTDCRIFLGHLFRCSHAANPREGKQRQHDGHPAHYPVAFDLTARGAR
jgi:hypothetical protein